MQFVTLADKAYKLGVHASLEHVSFDLPPKVRLEMTLPDQVVQATGEHQYDVTKAYLHAFHGLTRQVFFRDDDQRIKKLLQLERQYVREEERVR